MGLAVIHLPASRLMRLAIKKRARGGSAEPPQGEAGRCAWRPRTNTSTRATETEPWRKRGRCGRTRYNLCSPVSPMPWAWATCGASPICASCTAEVSARPATPVRLEVRARIAPRSQVGTPRLAEPGDPHHAAEMGSLTRDAPQPKVGALYTTAAPLPVPDDPGRSSPPNSGASGSGVEPRLPSLGEAKWQGTGLGCE